MRCQGVTSAEEKLADGGGGGFLVQGWVPEHPTEGPGEYPMMLLLRDSGVGQWHSGDLQEQVNTLH